MRASVVINHILNLPSFYKLKNYNVTTKALRAILGERKSALMRYAYIRAKCLYIGVKSPYGLQELRHDSNTTSIKNFLNAYICANKLDLDPIDDVKIFVVKSALYSLPKPYKPRQKELAKGEFSVRCKNSKLRELFEQIRVVVRQKYARQNA